MGLLYIYIYILAGIISEIYSWHLWQERYPSSGVEGLYFVQFRILKPVDLCGFIATHSSTIGSILLLALAFCTLCLEPSDSSCTVFQRL